jgi:hypothetical protein
MKEIKLTDFQKSTLAELNQGMANIKKQEENFCKTIIDANGESFENKSISYDWSTGILTVKDKE